MLGIQSMKESRLRELMSLVSSPRQDRESHQLELLLGWYAHPGQIGVMVKTVLI